MYIIIKGRTYRLKEFNSARRELFVQNILSNYSFGSFDNHIQKIQDEIFRLYNVKISADKAKKDFFKQFDLLINKTIWEFLKDEDKKEIGVIENLSVDEIEKIKFIEFYSDKVKELSELGQGGEKVDQITVHTFVAKHLGRSIEEVMEMDEMLLIELIEEITYLIKQERVDQVNLQALATAHGSGNKSAKEQIKKLSGEVKRAQTYKKMKDIKPEQLKETSNYSADELRRMLNGR